MNFSHQNFEVPSNPAVFIKQFLLQILAFKTY